MLTNLLAILLLVVPTLVHAESYNWIIGGGPKKENSQIQIERNVKWAREVINRQKGNPPVSVFYTDGDAPDADVVDFDDRDAPSSDNYILDLVFGGSDVHPARYKNHSVLNHAGTTDPSHMIPAIREKFSLLTQGDTALILYNGHGWGNSSDHGLGTLRLWGSVGYSVYDFENLISTINEETATRFILTQCYSGGFARLIHPDARGDTLELEGNRCGFMAESASREAEGCSASLNIGDYRDYTTFMFAALDGKTRLGEKLNYNPDINSDSRVSLREAHLYTLASAYSTDLSRSTSEYYLEKWLPWYLRWVPKSSDSENSIFHEIMMKVAKVNGMPVKLTRDANLLREEWKKRTDRLEDLEEEMHALVNSIESVQADIAEALDKDFPGLRERYNETNFKDNSDQYLREVISKILSFEKLGQLKQYFKKKDELDLVLLDAERSLTQVEKISRMQNLSRVDEMFSRFASKKIRLNHEQLISCEEGFL